MKALIFTWILITLFGCTSNKTAQSQSIFQYETQSNSIQTYTENAYLEIIASLEQTYDSIDPSIWETYIVSADDLFGVVNKEGNVIIPCEYDSIESADDCFVINSNDLFGLADRNGNILISPQYNELYYKNETISVTVYGPEGGAGVVDKNNNILVPLAFDNAEPFEKDWALVTKMDSKRANFIDINGQYLLNEDADKCEGFFGEYAYVKYNDNYYFINQTNTVFRSLNGIPIAYLNIDNLFLVDNNGVYYIYNAQNDEYIDLGCKMIDNRGFYEDLIAVKGNDEKWGFIDSKMNTVIPFMYDSVQVFCEGRTWVQQDGVYKLIDKMNTCYYSGNLQRACPFSEGLSAIKSDTGWGFIDQSGEIQLTPSIESNEDSLRFINGFCDLLWSDPYAATYIDHNFHQVIKYDIW